MNTISFYTRVGVIIMDTTKILVGSPVCQDPSILKEFLLSLANLDIDGLQADFLFIDDNTESQSRDLLKNFGRENCRVDIIEMSNSLEYIRTEVTHIWNDTLIWKVAAHRDMILDWAKINGYDYLLLIDSDLLLHPATLRHLILKGKDIISEIFWTSWAPGGKELPQVWLYDNYTLYELDSSRRLSDTEVNFKTQEFLNKLRAPGVYKVGGLGACTLISRKALNTGVSYGRISNLSFWGEDRHFCVRAYALGLELYVDTHYPAYHIYRKKEIDGAREFKQKCGYKAPV